MLPFSGYFTFSKQLTTLAKARHPDIMLHLPKLSVFPRIVLMPQHAQREDSTNSTAEGAIYSPAFQQHSGLGINERSTVVRRSRTLLCVSNCKFKESRLHFQGRGG